MSYSFTATESKTFTVTHARHMAAKVATDLKRMQRLYDLPSDASIANFEGEITELIRLGYLDEVTYGFQRNGNWIAPTLKYKSTDLASGSQDDDPGRVLPGCDISKAKFYSFLTYSAAWDALSQDQKESIKKSLPIQRSTASPPQVEGGYFADDKTYSSGGRALGRASLRSY